MSVTVKLFLACMFSFCFLGTFAQKKKEIRKYGIKTVTSTKMIGTKILNDSQQTFDGNGEVTEEKEYDEEGKLSSIIRYKYNPDGKVSEEARYDGANVLLEKRKMKYNVLLQKTEELVMDKDGKQIKKFVYAYNSLGFRSERKTYDQNNKLVMIKKTTYGYK